MQEDDVCGYLRTGVGKKGIVRQTDCADQLGAFRNIFADIGILLIHRPLGGDKRHNPARAHLIERFGEKIVMDQKTVFVIPLVMDGIAAERYVADGKVKKAVRQFRFLKALYGDTVLLIKLPGDPPGDRIQFHTE